MLVSLISRLVACSPRIVVDKQTDRHTHRTTTVTLAAHARRGLMKGTKVLTLGARAWRMAAGLVDWAIIIMAGHGIPGSRYRVQLLIRMRSAN